ncbi:hypothetical protein HOK021_39220 [Streptomyces hygroscopicus]|nr:hypothetical protein HOK021_39220 [Streptomyces hygroscopicus]
MRVSPCHASSVSQRRTVEGDTGVTIWRVMASRASSGHDQREMGTPVSAGSRQAGALTSVACSGVNEAGRPQR